MFASSRRQRSFPHRFYAPIKVLPPPENAFSNHFSQSIIAYIVHFDAQKRFLVQAPARCKLRGIQSK
jgi:hypothetical protein